MKLFSWAWASATVAIVFILAVAGCEIDKWREWEKTKRACIAARGEIVQNWGGRQFCKLPTPHLCYWG